MDNQRNLILAMVLAALILFGWDAAMNHFYPPPEPDALSETAAGEPQGADPAMRDGRLNEPAPVAGEPRDLATALRQEGRVAIDAPEVAGSINPVGARIDDLTLTGHRQALARESGPVRLFSPAGTPEQHFAQFGWVGEGVTTPRPDARWQAEGGPLAPGSPVTLRWNNGEGQIFAIRFAIDDQYMITATQTVINNAQGPIALQPVAQIRRTSATASSDTWNVHSGPIGAFGGSVEFGEDYEDIAEAGMFRPQGRPAWTGFTDIYWLSALVPEEPGRATADFRAQGNDVFLANLFHDPVTVPAGEQVSRTTRLFAGAKESAVLDTYEDSGVEKFGLAIDWGWFRWFEKPIFWLLLELFQLAGNFGVAIILLTLIVRLVMFPIAQKQFASMAQMRAVQPKMKALQERHKDDKQKLQSEMMALYKAEKVNPFAGCLPMFLQIPVFFALYKVLILSIEMRHQPFALWIKDLSAPDPATLLNLFGLLPFDPPGFLAIGVLALLLGFTMWLQFRLNPAQMDPTQQQIFMFMPWILMFVMAPFAAGLLLYWITSNILTIAQTKLLYARHPQLRAQAAEEKQRAAGEKEADKQPDPKPGSKSRAR